MTADAVRRTPKTWEEAMAFIAATYRPVAEAEPCAPAAAIGRIAAQDVIAPADLPGFDTAAMDGFALADDGEAGPYPVIGTLRAGGRWAFTLQPGEALRILTGAPVPAGTRRVVRDEDCRIEAGRLIPGGFDRAKGHIRRKGADLAAGTPVLPAGRRITPGDLALLSAIGIGTVPVRRRLEVCLLSTGDELVAGPGRIRDINGPMLRAELEALGCRVTGPAILPDDAAAIRTALVRAAQGCDLILTTGGASASETDHFARLIPERGFLELWRLAIKPGGPVALGDIDDCPILSLPGTPVAAAVAFQLIARPLIARLAGAAEAPSLLLLPLAGPARGVAGKLTALAARRIDTPGQALRVEAIDRQGSGKLMALGDAEGWILVPPDRPELEAEELVRFLPNPAFFGYS